MPETPLVLALQGSPRARGNSDALLEAFLEPVEAASLAVERIRVPRLDVKPCRGCHFCEKNGACIQKDGMVPMYERLLAARLVVLSTPIFFYNVEGRTKSFIDRCQVLWARKYLPAGGGGPVPISAPGRKGFCVAAGATRGKNLFKGLHWTVKYFFDAVDVSYEGVYGVRGLEESGDAARDPETLEGARREGRRLLDALDL